MWSCIVVYLCKQKTAYELRISDGSSDVCSSDLLSRRRAGLRRVPPVAGAKRRRPHALFVAYHLALARGLRRLDPFRCLPSGPRSAEHTSELQSLMRISYAVFCLKNKNIDRAHVGTHTTNEQVLHRLNLKQKSKDPQKNANVHQSQS